MHDLAKRIAMVTAMEQNKIIKENLERLGIDVSDTSRFSAICNKGVNALFIDGEPFITFYDASIQPDGDFKVAARFNYKVHQ